VRLGHLLLEFSFSLGRPFGFPRRLLRLPFLSVFFLLSRGCGFLCRRTSCGAQRDGIRGGFRGTCRRISRCRFEAKCSTEGVFFSSLDPLDFLPLGALYLVLIDGLPFLIIPRDVFVLLPSTHRRKNRMAQIVLSVLVVRYV